jgi:hypothetical protein
MGTEKAADRYAGLTAEGERLISEAKEYIQNCNWVESKGMPHGVRLMVELVAAVEQKPLSASTRYSPEIFGRCAKALCVYKQHDQPELTPWGASNKTTEPCGFCRNEARAVLAELGLTPESEGEK